MKNSNVEEHNTSKLSSKNANLVAVAVKWIILGMKIQMERRHILTLEDDQLRDVGISRSEAIREGQRSFGDIPDDRLPNDSSTRAHNCGCSTLKGSHRPIVSAS